MMLQPCWAQAGHEGRMSIDTSHIRNFSIVAHIDHGKSTISDRILELTHTVEERYLTSQMLDSMDIEQ